MRLEKRAAIAAVAALSWLAEGCDAARGGATTVTAAPREAPAMPTPVQEERDDAGAPSAAASSEPVAPFGPMPLAASGPLIGLDVPGFSQAVVSVPLGATSKRPVVVATHGNYDRPEWQCDVWRGIAGGSVFVLCPRGIERRDSPSEDDVRFTYRDNKALERELDAALAALATRFPDHVDSADVVYTGFSLGAIMGVAIFGRGDNAKRFPRAALVEGGHDRWTPALAKTYAKGGGKRVLFACGQPGCVHAAKTAARLLENAGVATKIVHGKNMGHTYDGAVAEEVAAAWSWLLEGDERFGGEGGRR